MSCKSLIFCNKSLPDCIEDADPCSAPLGSEGPSAGEEVVEGAAGVEEDAVSSAPEVELLPTSAMARSPQSAHSKVRQRMLAAILGQN